ncbi:MAG: Asp-tRNA(Asn)/Glu-tRNA(Gln) amidotransferase GatCAB subunit B, partial [Desulfuromonadales bacterium]|nr:Asp-tRNA(Asn)/Glu-tRNA(Gln) amidotransferase GatCAB subunit B [Desulfuromonadales bacterium]
CDANVSIRPWGQPEYGTRAEIKNINSFRFIKQAIEYEVERQAELIEDGGRVVQETRLYDAESGTTRSMRGKEEAHDYRYFPDPDLVPIEISRQRVEEVRAALPELPIAKLERFTTELGLPARDAEILIAEQEIAGYFDACVVAGAPPKAAANWILGELSRNLNNAGISITACQVTPALLVGMLQRIDDGTISGKQAKIVFEKMWAEGRTADAIIDSEGLRQVSDSGAIEGFIAAIIAANPAQVADYKSGNDKIFGFFVGQVMKASKGQANPAAVNELLKKKLAE